MFEIVLANFSVFNIAKKLGWETFWDSVKFTWDSTFVDALGPRDPIEIKPKSNTAREYYISAIFRGVRDPCPLPRIHA